MSEALLSLSYSVNKLMKRGWQVVASVDCCLLAVTAALAVGLYLTVSKKMYSTCMLYFIITPLLGDYIH